MPPRVCDRRRGRVEVEKSMVVAVVVRRRGRTHLDLRQVGLDHLNGRASRNRRWPETVDGKSSRVQINRGLRQWGVNGTSTPSPAHDGVLVSLDIQKQFTRQVKGPWRAPCQLIKALQGSRRETRELQGGTEERGVTLMRGHWIALHANQWIFTRLAFLIFDC